MILPGFFTFWGGSCDDQAQQTVCCESEEVFMMLLLTFAAAFPTQAEEVFLDEQFVSLEYREPYHWFSCVTAK
jgi:hypothetical protein